MDCPLSRCLPGLVPGRWFSVFLPPQFRLLELQVKTANEDKEFIFISMAKKSCCCIKSCE